MKKNFLQLYLILFLFIFSACSPQFSIVSLRTQAETGQNEAFPGRQMVSLDQAGISFKCDYLQSTAYDLLFEVSIVNDSDQEITISPSDFRYYALDEKGYDFGKMHAYDPDKLVFEISQVLEESKDALDAERGIGWLITGLNVISAASSFANDEDEAGVFYSVEAATSLVASSLTKKQIKKQIVSLEGERDYYRNATMKPCSLAPGESTNGIVVFPRVDEAQQLAVEYHINNQVFEIIYEQTLHRARR